MKRSRILFYLLLILLPVQLGRHFFFDFSFVSGLRVDYLAPTVYLTDLLIFTIILSGLFPIQRSKQVRTVALIFSSALFHTLFIAINQNTALYYLVKMIEYVLLGLTIIKMKPSLQSIATALSVSVLFSSILALWQFALQHSIGGFFWWIGERSFYASTPGIAAMSWHGRLLLRPYASFPHPNVLGGFLAVSIVMFYFVLRHGNPGKKLRLWLYGCLGIGTITLLFTFSRSALLAAAIGIFFLSTKSLYRIQNQKWRRIALLITSLLALGSMSIQTVLPSFFITCCESVQQRVSLAGAAWQMVQEHPLFGVGLNNFISQLRAIGQRTHEQYILQPVHNVPLLILAEVGVVGFFAVLYGAAKVIYKSSRGALSAVLILLFFVLGAFDHYLLTVQQGQILTTLLISLAFLPQNTVN